VIKRVDRGKNHWYIDEDTGERIPGVTTILKNLPKDALINWSASSTAEYAIDNWDRLSELAPSARLKELMGARFAARDAAANRGTQVHRLAERLVKGEQVKVPDALVGYVESYVRFLDEYDVQPILVEAVVHSATHNYCGTLDLAADMLDPDDTDQRVTAMVDIKTSRSGIFGETALQLGAYAFADHWVDPDARAEYEIPQCDRFAGVHVRADGYDVVPLEVGPLQHRQFLYLMQVAEFVATSRDLVGTPVSSPHLSTYQLTEVGNE
jgi:hypothetical protein